MYYFIVNPGSRTGKGEGLWTQLETQIRQNGIEYEVFFTAGEGDATRLAERICIEHPEPKNIVMVGGDGTANEIVNGLSGYSNILLGYIPTGSSNDLARGLGIAQDPAAALERILHPTKILSVDHGVVQFPDEDAGTNGAGQTDAGANGAGQTDADADSAGQNGAGTNGAGQTGSRRFAVSSGIGYNADICYEALTSPLKSFLNRIHLGKLIYYLLGIKLIFTNKRAAAELIIDGDRKMKTDALMFADAMNTVYEGGGMPMGPGADPTDGQVTVCVVHDISRLKHMLLMPAIIKAKHINHKGVELITCRTLEVITDRPLVVHTDGEFAGKHSHVVFSCMPEQIRMTM